MSREDFASKMYELGCSYSFGSGAYSTSLHLSGLGENLPQAIKLYEDMLLGAVADAQVLENVKSDYLKNRSDSKLNQSACFDALTNYMIAGPEYIAATTPSNGYISSVSSEELLQAVKDVLSKGHEIKYYGPMNEKELKAALEGNHYVAEGAQILEERYSQPRKIDAPEVLLAQYDAKQLYYYQYSNRGEAFDAAQDAAISMYNEYFGGGMNAIVFQEMREARGLAYSAPASLSSPSFAGDNYKYFAFIATQNDKMRQAIEAFDEIINDMPQSEAAFQVAKDALIGRMRTARTTGMNVIRSYQSCRRLGLSEPVDKKDFAQIQGLGLEDVCATQQKWVKGRCYKYAILGDIKDLDTKYLATLGKVKVLSLEDIFGY